MKNLTQSELVGQVQKEIERYNLALSINPPYAQRQKDIINLCDFYYMSRYRDGDSDTLGQQKVFYNIVVLPVEVACKSMDIDTKNIQLKSSGENYWTSWIKGKELDLWMKTKYFGRQLNLYTLYFAKYGHLFVKKVRDEVMVVNPRQVIVRGDAEDLEQTPILEHHSMPRDAYYKMAKESGWENYKLTPDEEKEGRDVEFFEMYYPKGFWDSDYNYFIVRPGAQKVMVATNLNENPYKALAWEKVPGRFLGRGQIEKLLEDQIYLNRLANYKAEGLHWTSKHIYQTRDNSLMANLLTGTDNGDVLFVKSELTPVANEERNLGMYSYEETRWENMAMRKSFTTESITGETAPSGMPLGTSMLQAQMTTGYYDTIKENLGSFVEEIIWDWVLPEFEKENNKEHELVIKNLIAGSDDYSNKFFEYCLSQRMKDRKIAFLKAGKWMTDDQYKIIKGVQSDLLKREKIKIKKGAYSNLQQDKADIMLDIVGEHIDSPAKLNSLWNLITLMGQNPAIMRDPNIKKPIMMALNLSGFNPHDFVLEEETDTISAAQQLAPQGGSVAAQPTNSIPTSMPGVAYSSR